NIDNDFIYCGKIQPVENVIVSVLTLGEGWHNYHHTFPWDYKAAELGNYGFNTTTLVLDMFAKIGWAYDLKYAFDELVHETVEKHDVLIGWIGIFGVTAGAHRLWTHRSYKAKLPLRIILIICFSFAGQNTLFEYFGPMKLFFAFILPTLVPYYLWNETFYWSFMGSIIRYVYSLNCIWLVNSAAHMFGNKPYDR
ncbi:hypothetical protein BDFB_009642, partial [Asbolus verrucosus]